MTHKKIPITLLALLLSATATLPIAAAAKQEVLPVQITTKIIGQISCSASSIEKNADGSLKKCVLTESKTIPGADITCAANQSITFDADGNAAQCTLNINRTYPDPIGVICEGGKSIEVYPNGSLAKCSTVSEKKTPLYGGSCSITKPVAFYPDGQVKECLATTGKKVPEANTKEVYVSDFTCAANSMVAAYPDGKLQKCTPTEPIYMRGKGTCLAGESVTLQPDGKVQECTYTYPLYQNNSCKVESRASFHPNGSFKDCTLPADRPVGKAVCKADAPVSYRPDGNVASCTLASSVEQAPGKAIPAGTIVNFDEKQVITEKTVTTAQKPAVPEKPVTSDKK